ncbi:MAG: hypothetical protein KJ734_01275, partial [Chloroflexi bacterium]|nr:hypothetical protein [Chloroflexota bacterium]
MEPYYSSYVFTPYSWTLIFTTLISLALALVLWRRRAVSSARYLALLELAVAEWAFAVAFEFAATDVSLKLLWGQIG